MEQAEAGSGLQDVPGAQTMTNGSRPEDYEAYENAYEKGTERRQLSPENAGVESIALCASPGDFAPRPRQQTSERESVGGMIRKGVVDHQLGLSLNLVLLVALTYLMFPSLRQTVGAFCWLQYANDKSGSFAQGPRDLYLVAGFVVIFTGLRAACLDYLLLPLAGKLGIRQKKAKVRFAEQAYLLLYYVVYWTWGLVIFFQDTPPSDATTVTGFVNDLLISLWRDFPRLTLGASLKLYYLSQTAFWIQQIFVINIEERRKDHWQMFTHHIVTVGLLVFSYGYRQMRAGNAVLVLMDVVDLIFPVSPTPLAHKTTNANAVHSSRRYSVTLAGKQRATWPLGCSSSCGSLPVTSATSAYAGPSTLTSATTFSRTERTARSHHLRFLPKVVTASWTTFFNLS